MDIILQDSLGGNSKTLMFANIGPACYNYDETLSTLRYANRAKSIKNNAKINEDPKDALMRQYQKEIEELRRQIEADGGGGGEEEGSEDDEESEGEGAVDGTEADGGKCEWRFATKRRIDSHVLNFCFLNQARGGDPRSGG